MKYFCDRFRRCEAFRKGGSWAKGKNINLVAAAGVPAMGQQQRWSGLKTGVAFCDTAGANRHNSFQSLKYSFSNRGCRQTFGQGRFLQEVLETKYFSSM